MIVLAYLPSQCIGGADFLHPFIWSLDFAMDPKKEQHQILYRSRKKKV
jgi:hypothetical protein